jgi:sulfur-oxidizing protein SoxY
LPHSFAQFSRREALAAAGLGLAAIAAGGLMVSPAHATPDDLRAAMKKYTNGAEPKTGRVTLTMAEVAENGATVPYTVKVDSPMTEADHVKTIYILADGNAFPEAANFHLTPDCGVAEVSGRMRLAKTQNVYALAAMSDGSFYMAKTEVKVTVGGCG